MGGGFSGSGFSGSQLKGLEQIARDVLKEAKPPAKRNVFISFASEDINDINLLRGQAKNENMDLEFIDRSLQKPFDSKDANYIKRGIRERIKQASATICYISEESAKSKWVEWEINESIRQQKGVIAVYKGKVRPKNIPKFITGNNIKIIPWQHDKLVAEIERAAKNRQ